jgi:hypothetical protein
MLRIALLLVCCALFSSAAVGAETVLFAEPFDGKLKDGWQWLREKPDAWRLANKALEIRIGGQDNFLVRDLPKRTEAPYAVEVTLTNLSPPKQQYEQGGFGWHVGDKQVFKFVKERIDGEVYVFPGKRPVKEATTHMRLLVEADKVTAQYREPDQQEWQTAFSRPLPEAEAGERIALMCFHGPPDAEHWLRLENFRIIKLARE